MPEADAHLLFVAASSWDGPTNLGWLIWPAITCFSASAHFMSMLLFVANTQRELILDMALSRHAVRSITAMMMAGTGHLIFLW